MACIQTCAMPALIMPMKPFSSLRWPLAFRPRGPAGQTKRPSLCAYTQRQDMQGSGEWAWLLSTNDRIKSHETCPAPCRRMALVVSLQGLLNVHVISASAGANIVDVYISTRGCPHLLSSTCSASVLNHHSLLCFSSLLLFLPIQGFCCADSLLVNIDTGPGLFDIIHSFLQSIASLSLATPTRPCQDLLSLLTYTRLPLSASNHVAKILPSLVHCCTRSSQSPRSSSSG
jgi:hypothetical protein